MRAPDAEAWLSSVNEAIKAYKIHETDANAAGGLTFEQATAKLKALGLSEGDAIKYLRKKR